MYIPSCTILLSYKCLYLDEVLFSSPKPLKIESNGVWNARNCYPVTTGLLSRIEK